MKRTQGLSYINPQSTFMPWVDMEFHLMGVEKIILLRQCRKVHLNQYLSFRNPSPKEITSDNQINEPTLLLNTTTTDLILKMHARELKLF